MRRNLLLAGSLASLFVIGYIGSQWIEKQIIQESEKLFSLLEKQKKFLAAKSSGTIKSPKQIYKEANYIGSIKIDFAVSETDALNKKLIRTATVVGSVFAIKANKKPLILTSAHLFNKEGLIEELNWGYLDPLNPLFKKIIKVEISSCSIIFKNNLEIFEVEPYDIDNHFDLAKLRIKNKGRLSQIPTGKLSEGKPILVGDFVMTIGNPLDHFFIFTLGNIAHLCSTSINGISRQVIFTSEMIGKGSSGGPLLNEEGEIIGIAFETFFIPPHSSIFIHLNEIRGYLNQYPD